MKIFDKRNKNKMKTEHKSKINKTESKIYNNEHGPYKVVSFVNLGGDMSKIKIDFLDNQSRRLYYHKNKMTNFLFQDTQSLNDYEISYITRSSDIVVFVVNSKDIDPKKILLIKRHLPSCLFVILDKIFLKTCKKFVKEYIPDQKIIEVGSLIDYLCLIKIKSTNICSRPYMVPLTINYDGEFLIAKGFMKKGLVSDKVIINGKYDGIITDIRDDNIKPEELSLSDEEKSNFITVRDFNDNEMEIEEDEFNDGSVDDEDGSNGSDEDEFEDDRMDIEFNDEDDGMDIEDDNEIDYNKINDNKIENNEDDNEKYQSMITKYSEYRGIRNISTCEFNTDKYPEYYKNLLFFQDFKHVKKFITERNSKILDNQILEIKIKINQPVTDNIFVIFNYYDFEEYNTIHNFAYSTVSKIKTGEKLYVDLGHKIIEVSPTVTKNVNQNTFKREESLENGVISFIGPLSFNINKILIFEENLLKEISNETYKCMGVNLGIKERKLYDEVVLKGLPIKIHKRSCIIKRMFYSKEEVLYFKDVRLHTKNGRSNGYIKKPLGVHGSFRAYFSHPIASNDKILMSLYKRAFLEDYTN